MAMYYVWIKLSCSKVRYICILFHYEIKIGFYLSNVIYGILFSFVMEYVDKLSRTCDKVVVLLDENYAIVTLFISNDMKSVEDISQFT